MPCTVGIAKSDGKPCQVYMNMQLEDDDDPRLIVITPAFALNLSRLLAESARCAMEVDLASGVPSAN